MPNNHHKSVWRRINTAINGISLRILFTYMSILLIPLIAIVIIYSTSTKALLQYQKDRTMYSLEKTAEIVQLQLEELHNIASYIQSNPTVNAIINSSKRSEGQKRDIYMMKTALESFPSYELTNQLIKHTYIFFKESNFTAKLPSGFVDSRHAYDDNVNFHGLNYDEFNELCSLNNMNRLLVSSDDENTDLLLLRNVSDSNTLIVIQVDIPALVNVLEANDTGEHGSTYILNANHEYLAGSGDIDLTTDELISLAGDNEMKYLDIDISGTSYLSYVYPHGGLTYISLTEKNHLLSKIASIKYVIIAISAIAFILGVMLCMTLWQRRRQTVIKIQQTAQSLGIMSIPPRNENQLFERTFTGLTDAMALLQQEVKQQRDILADTLLRKLVSGGFTSESDLLAELDGVGLDINATAHHLVKVIPIHSDEISGDKNQTLPYRIFLKQFLEKHVPFRHLIFDLDNRSFMILLLLDEELPSTELRNIFVDLTHQIEEMDWIAPSFAISDGCEAALQYGDLMSQIEKIDEYLTCTDTLGVFTIDDLPQTLDVLYFPISEEMQLQRILKSASLEDLESYWYHLLQENIINRTLRVEMLVELRDRMRLAVLRVLTDNLKEDESQALAFKIHNTKSIQALFNYAELAMYAINASNAQDDVAEHDETKLMIQETIDRELSDSGFNLSQLAEAVDMPESVLYRNFKSYFGVSFANYLEQCRIDKAFELLRGQVLVKDVAKLVGYTSDHSFRRAFKRIMKVPPSQFQELNDEA